MLVRVTKQSDGLWSVVALSGHFYNQEIAKVEAIRLRQARFQRKSLTGHVASTWGTQVAQIVYDDEEGLDNGETLKGLGLGRAVRFEESPHEAAYDEADNCWYDIANQQNITDAFSITAMGARVYYATAGARRATQDPAPLTLSASTDPSLPERPQRPPSSFITKVKAWFVKKA